MYMNDPGTISVVTREEEEINADSADVLVRIEGSSLFSGSEAFRKAEEVRALVTQLKEVGIEEDQFKLRSVEVDSSSFSLLKGSSAKYWIKVRKVSLELLPKVLGAIGDQKNCVMNRIDWNYSESENQRTALRSRALSRALTIAREDAKCLGVSLIGIRSVTEEGAGAAKRSQPSEYVETASFRTRAKKSKAVDLNFTLGNSATLRVAMRVIFQVSEFSSS